MKLFTKDIDKKLFAQYHLGNNIEEQYVVAKIFNPYGNGRWYLLNSDPNDPNYLWAIVQMGNVVEIGSIHRQDLEAARVGKFRLPLERDLSFSQEKADVVLKGLMEGKFFKHGGSVHKDGEVVYEEVEFEEYADGGEIEWGEDLGDDFSVGNDVYITDSKSMFKGKTGFVSGLAGKDLLVTISENGNDRSVVVRKKGVQKLDAPEYAKGGVIGSSNTKEGIEKLIGDYYYSKNISLKKIDDKNEYEVSNSKGKINGVKVVLSKGRYQFVESDKMAMGGKLIDKQKNLDLNKNGKLDAEDFKMIRGEKMAHGGKVHFKDKVKAIQDRLKGTKVKGKYQSKYGKKYDIAEAHEAAEKIAGAMMRNERMKK